MKIWISKYALSSGITEHDCEPDDAGRVYPGSPYMSFYGFTMGKEAHATKEGAIRAAERLRDKKIASVKKQLAKLEAMRFA